MTKHPWCFILLASFLVWDYTAPPTLSMFVMYLHKPGQKYDWKQPSWTVVSFPEAMHTEIPCLELTLTEPGPWHAVMKAMDTGGQQSDPSNEIVFTWDRLTGCTVGTSIPTLPPPPSTPPMRPTPIPPVPPYTPPVVFKPPPPVVAEPPLPPSRDGSTGGGGISSHCIWTGDCGKSRLSK